MKHLLILAFALIASAHIVRADPSPKDFKAIYVNDKYVASGWEPNGVIYVALRPICDAFGAIISDVSDSAIHVDFAAIPSTSSAPTKFLEQPKTLQGAPSFDLIVDLTNTEKNGLSEDLIKGWAKSQLAVYQMTTDEATSDYLHISINCVKATSLEAYAITFRAEFVQRCNIPRLSARCMAITWTASTTEICGSSTLSNEVHSGVNSLIDQFTTTYNLQKS